MVICWGWGIVLVDDRNTSMTSEVAVVPTEYRTEVGGCGSVRTSDNYTGDIWWHDVPWDRDGIEFISFIRDAPLASATMTAELAC